MNIFEQYLDKIKKIILDQAKNGELVLPERLDGITAEMPPAKFNSDISTNVAMFLSKLNNKPPLELAKLLAKPINCLLYTSPSPRDLRASRMPSSA